MTIRYRVLPQSHAGSRLPGIAGGVHGVKDDERLAIGPCRPFVLLCRHRSRAAITPSRCVMSSVAVAAVNAAVTSSIFRPKPSAIVCHRLGEEGHAHPQIGRLDEEFVLVLAEAEQSDDGPAAHRRGH